MFFDTFYALCKNKGVSCKRAVLDMGLSNSIATKWKKTAATPAGETLQRIAEYFDVSVDYLLHYDQDMTKSEELMSIYYCSVVSQINNVLISGNNQKNLKGHLAELLLRYKYFTEAIASKNQVRIEETIASLEAWISVSRDFALSDEDKALSHICTYGS